jgi:hypothetical protein
MNNYQVGGWVDSAAAKDNTFCTWPPRSPDLTVCGFFLRGFRQGQCLRHRNQEGHTRHASEGLAGMGVSPGHLPCHTWGANRVHLRSL